MSTTGNAAIQLYNTLTRSKELFVPLDEGRVRMYVCGPTVYDNAHIGNARPAIVFDALFRLLRRVYGPEHVIYARNLTDVDDKINLRARHQFPELEPEVAIRRLTEATTEQYHRDVAALGVLPPTVEPRATDHIDEMRVLCELLVARGHAYVAEGHVLFDTSSMADYGRLANRSLEEMEAGARVDIAPYKRGAMDFVLWKPSKPEEPGWPSPCGIDGRGRPGWHIECSAMAGKHLGTIFDIHGGGIDLVFPHHENEVAQSRCAHGTQVMARYWMHNGFLQVEGEKMSKSLGNFITIKDLLTSTSFGDQAWHGRVLRFAMLSTHYRQPIDFTVERLNQAKGALTDFATIIADAPVSEPNPDVFAALCDDLNTVSAISILHGIARSAKRGDRAKASELRSSLELLGLYGGERPADLSLKAPAVVDPGEIEGLIAARNEARRQKDYKESDRIRDQLSAMGVQLADKKNPSTGEIETTWELKT